MSYTKQNFQDDRVLMAEELERIEDGILERIPAPSVAAVGQTIVVSAVDENGKPIEWEAGNISTEDTWELLCDVTLEEETNSFEVKFEEPQKKLRVIVDTMAAAANTNYSAISVFMNNEAGTTYLVERLMYPEPIPKTQAMRAIYDIETYYRASVPFLEVNTHLAPPNHSYCDYNPKRFVYDSLTERYSTKMMVPEIVKFRQNTYATFAVGTRYKIFGVKAE